ncbi:hypothetical protein GCK32_014658, partial [Trichostrongylus colubriformis]
VQIILVMPPPQNGGKSAMALVFTAVASLTGAVYYFYMTEVVGDESTKPKKKK